MMKIGCAAFVAAGLVASKTSTVLATHLPKNATQVYSSLCWSQESGDAAGYRIKIAHDDKKQSLSIEWSDGPKEGPTQASKLVIDPKTKQLKFILQSPIVSSPSGKYIISGKITNEAIVLEQWDWGDGQAPGRIHDIIPRVVSSDDKIETCK